MKKRAILLLVSLLLAVACLTGCSKEDTPTSTESTEASLKIMFVVTGNLGGGTNNDDVNKALNDYVTKAGGSVDTYECNMDTSVYETTLKQAAESGNYDLIVTGFGTMAEPVQNTAAQYADQKFLIFDTSIDYTDGKNPNIISVQVNQNHGAFMAGALAALLTKSGVEGTNEANAIGFVGAMESVAVVDCLIGYIEGAKYVDETIDVQYAFVGNHNDSALTKEMALTQNQAGADVIYGVSQSDLAVADAALEKNFYAICSDADDAKTIEATSKDTANHIVTSVIKDYYNMVYPILEKIGNCEAEFGKHISISYADGGVKLARNEYFDAILPEEVKTQFEEIEKKIINGEIEVDSAYNATAEKIQEIKASASGK